MSVPTTVFIDTSIFDESAYNFESASMTAFKNSIADQEITLLMPDPTLREIRRHMEEKTEAAVRTLESAARKAPFLRKLENWLLADQSPEMLRYKLGKIAKVEFDDFLNQFEIAELDYEGVDLNEIMDWYDREMAPFSNRKKAEFPDALAVAAIEKYRRTIDESVAIISKDGDFKNACERFPGLMYFPSLVAYSEALASADERLSWIQASLASESASVNEQISNQFVDSGFVVEANWEGDVEDVEVIDLEGLGFHVVGIGEDRCTIAFEGEIEYSAYVSYGDLDSATYEKGMPAMIHHDIKGTVQETAEISGVIMATIDNKEQRITSLDRLDLDQSDFTIHERPDEY